jgi:hypothetical protein
VKYLAGAYHVAGGNAGRAVHYYAAGYYYAAKAKGRGTQPEQTGSDAFASAPGRSKTVQAALTEGPSASPASPNFGARLND